ncbi:unnamed protein product [Bursaphelenchus okinawaensis]|uniref:non-specific serine/threonine protein kinase n=1 Tax=Bursaphelenchus okinawaensis TaxID=465554 RepID=A0A811JU04_9BILA|nr:unnamed protein product [Bursaphelenchus okinawaensis]CAG9082515.1 unnamed protein product [Bursaphelenchus okinawaensis]
MASENEPFRKSKTMSVTVGNPDGDSEDEEIDVRERFKAMAMAEDQPIAHFVEDNEVILPSTSTGHENFRLDKVHELISHDFSVLNDHEFVEPVVQKPPKIINGYLFGDLLGEGSYSKVKEVIDSRTLVRRSIKIIKDKRLKKIPFGEKNVQHEIHILRQVRHENVVRLLENFRVEEKEKLYLVMEYCTCSLQQLLDASVEKKLQEFQAHGYLVQLLEGVDYLHLKGVIHKDIKPGNLLLSSDGCLKICDMGVAELLETSDPLNDDWCTLSQGTPKFQPPEVVSGNVERFRGRPVDIWACGVTLYNMISGDYPFNGDGLMKLFENITQNDIEWPEDIKDNRTLHTLLKGVLEKDPDNRWNTVTIRAGEWFKTEFQVKLDQMVSCGPRPEHDQLDVLQRWDEPAEEQLSERPLIADEKPDSEPTTEQNSRSRGFFKRIWCPWRRRHN